jgi:hypothetical protein
VEAIAHVAIGIALSGKEVEVRKAANCFVAALPCAQVLSNQFRRSAETLIKDAKDKNLDAAALTYVEMTLTCVRFGLTEYTTPPNGLSIKLRIRMLPTLPGAEVAPMTATERG